MSNGHNRFITKNDIVQLVVTVIFPVTIKRVQTCMNNNNIKKLDLFSKRLRILLYTKYVSLTWYSYIVYLHIIICIMLRGPNGRYVYSMNNLKPLTNRV